MTLPASYPLSMSQINVELGRASNATTSLTESAVRTLAGVPSGAVSFSNLLGKSSFSASGNGDAQDYVSTSSGNADSHPSVTASGGTTPYTYLWSFTSNPNGASLLNSTSATATVRKAFSANQTGAYSAVLQCVVTENNGSGTAHTVTGINAGATWTAP